VDTFPSDVWEELNRLQEELESCSAEDGLAVLNQLREQKAFSFHVHVNYNYLIPALEGGCVMYASVLCLFHVISLLHSLSSELYDGVVVNTCRSNEVVRLRLGSFNPVSRLSTSLDASSSERWSNQWGSHSCVLWLTMIMMNWGAQDALLNLEDLARLSDLYEGGKEEARKGMLAIYSRTDDEVTNILSFLLVTLSLSFPFHP
jgi:hypothetical protein